MREKRVREALAAHVERRDAEAPVGGGLDESAGLTDAERAELASLILIADQLDERMRPVHPSPGFVRSLGTELVEEAKRRIVKRQQRQRVAMISAALAGAIVSVASLAGGVVLLIRWLRTRTAARQASAA
ncbi:MAG: hypothetical protein PVH80_02225 [Anaerolineae bacterium]|jgi:hypothetical protein